MAQPSWQSPDDFPPEWQVLEPVLGAHPSPSASTSQQLPEQHPPLLEHDPPLDAQHDWVLHDWLWLVEPEQPDPHTLGLGLLHVRVRLWVPPPQDLEQPDQPVQPLQPPLMGVQVHGLFTPPPL